VLPCLLFEDDDLLAVNKPAGLNTHAPSPYAGEGLYEWLRHREPRWANLAIIHRLDKDTSGIIVFAKTLRANRSLTQQFTNRTVRKKYLLLTDRPIQRRELTVKSALARAGDKYVSRPLHSSGDRAETFFRLVENTELGRWLASAPEQSFSALPPALRVGSHILEAAPRTGRTHQIRVHAADRGFPILGDTLYGGTAAARVYLHAAELALCKPSDGEELVLRAPLDWDADACLQLRAALVDPKMTDAWRVLHGGSDGWTRWYVDRLGAYLLSESDQSLSEAQRKELERLCRKFDTRGVYHKISTRRASPLIAAPTADDEDGAERGLRSGLGVGGPEHGLGEAAPHYFVIRENGVQFELSFHEGPSVGIFLDQRDNRRRLLMRHVGAGFPLYADQREAAPEVLNAFAYTCAFSVCAAKGGARTTSVDLSRKYLEWGQRNFSLNGIDPAGHEFLYGDVFEWLRRLGRKQRSFDAVLLDPPTFSRSKTSGVFRAQKDYGRLVRAALPLVKPGGVLFASTNAAGWPPQEFLAMVEVAIQSARRKVVQRQYTPQPPDFPISRSEPAYLKPVWVRIE